MDFQGLSRRELQTLCKKNKIPANMTNLAMADALSALTHVDGIEDIGKSLPQTPLTSRKTSTRKPTKPQSDPIESEPESSLTRTRRAPRKLIQEDEQEIKEPQSVTENPSIPEIPKTPATRTARKRATGTSVSRKTNTQTKEGKEEGKDGKEKGIPVVTHAYSTRRSTRLQQSEPKISESVQKRGGRRREAVKIDMLSEEETDNLEKESKSEVIDEFQKNEDQDDLVSADVSATMVSAESLTSERTGYSECTEKFTGEYSNGDQDINAEESSATVTSSEVSSTNIAHVLDECKEELTSNGDQDVTSEDSSAIVISAEESNRNIAHVLDESSPLEEKTQNPKMNSLPSVEDQNMKDVDQATEVDEDDEGKTSSHDLELKLTVEDEFCDVMVTEVEEFVLDESSPLEEKTQNPEDSMMNSQPSAEEQCIKDEDYQSIDINEDDEGKNSHDLELKLTVEDELCDVKVTEVEELVLDESSAAEEKAQNLEDSSGECLMGSLPSDQDEANEINDDELYDVKVTEVKESSLQSEIWDFGCIKDSMQELMSNQDAQQEYEEAENSVADGGLEDQMVELEKSDPVADEETEKSQMDLNPTYRSEDMESEKFSPNANVDDADFDLIAEENQMVELEKSVSVADEETEKSQMDLNPSYGSEGDMESEKSSPNANVDAADFDLTADTDFLDDEVQWSDSEISDDNDVEKISFSSSATDSILNQNQMSVLTPTKITASDNQIQATPLKSSSKKKAPTTPIIKVLDDNNENNESDKVSLRSNSKVLPVVAEEKENNENNKGENTAQRKIKGMSLRQLRKKIKQIKLTDDNTTTTTTTGNNKNTVVKEQLEKKRSALQTLNDNCLVGENEI